MAENDILGGHLRAFELSSQNPAKIRYFSRLLGFVWSHSKLGEIKEKTGRQTTLGSLLSLVSSCNMRKSLCMQNLKLIINLQLSKVRKLRQIVKGGHGEFWIFWPVLIYDDSWRKF